MNKVDFPERNEAAENDFIEEQFQALIEDYLNSPHRKKTDIINRAYQLAKDAHNGARRRSGEPYIIHPIAVARIACRDLGLGSTSISAALLHDVVEDTEYTVEDIAQLFGEKVAEIVDGLTKIAGGKFGEHASEQAENFRKLLLTMSNDIRVILIKIADRLHNMRTLDSMPPAKQYKIAGETLYLYAPLAHRLGLYPIKSELEDLSFKYEHREVYEDLSTKISAGFKFRKDLYDRFEEPLLPRFRTMGLRFEMKARIKSVYSIWKKMQKKGISFEEVYDLFAVRIIFTPREGYDERIECWNIYDAITDVYRLHPERIRDWIKTPKANGYQALHLTVMGPNGQWIEIQIRSGRMDDIAERGLAAHFHYKNSDTSLRPEDISREFELDKFLGQIREILEHPEPNTLDMLDTIKLNLYASEIFVFTPKGEMKTIPQGATALDFAFTIHSNIGYQCIGAKVNHQLVPMSYVLESGDQIEILTSRSQVVKPEWLTFVSTARAKSRIDSRLKRDRKQIVLQGEEQAKVFFEKNVKDPVGSIQKLLDSYSISDVEEFYYRVGIGALELTESLIVDIKQGSGFNVFRYLLPIKSDKKSKLPKEKTPFELTVVDKKKTFKLKEEELNERFFIQPCCHPLPGDPALGYLCEDNRIEVHKQSCAKALKLKSSFGNRVLSTKWDAFSKHLFPVHLKIGGIDGIGVLNEITRVLSTELSANIRRICVETIDGVFDGDLVVEVHNAEEVKRLSLRLAKISNVKTANRVEFKEEK